MSELNFQCLLGIQCNDFVMIAADQTLTQSVLLLGNDGNKLYEVSDTIVMGLNGDMGDTTQFAEFVAKNLKLYKMRNSYSLKTAPVAHFTRNHMVEAFHKGTPKMLNILIAGYDEECGGQLYTMDFLASCMKVPHASHGLGGYLSLGILDQYYKPNLTEKEAYEVLKLCVHEIQQRLFINLSNFGVKTVSRHGIRQLPTINTASFLQT
ncbi:unnamed protein product [Parnassius mnemosyne]|uniref:Proteasome subunit beta n=1 Tax=Parnassius mnemosyne TaxID=213953 RepID=A0AAV1M4N5_9NEOP